MSVTHGGAEKGKQFNWHLDLASDRVLIKNKEGREHAYSVVEIQRILETVHRQFPARYFPLANNVEKLGKGTEKLGLGQAILEQPGSDVNHAQGSSYLGVVLEESGYLAWNGQCRGIAWRFKITDFALETIRARLAKTSGVKG